MASDGQGSPAITVQRLASGYMGAQVVYVAAKLGLADLLASGINTPGQLAEQTGTDPDALRRLLRALGGLGLVTPDSSAGWQLTPTGECLREDHPQSVRHLVVMSGEEHYRVWSNLLHSVRTGAEAVEKTLGQPLFTYLAAHPGAAATFHRGMADLVRNLHLPALSSIDFSGSGTVVDVGGGTGSVLRHLLRTYPHLAGVLFDLPEVVAGAAPELRTGDLAGRCQLVPGDFFDKVPAGYDTYLLSIVVHDYDDDRATRLLRNIRAAMPPDGQLLLLELVVPASDGPHPRTLNDLNMLVMSGGRERSEPEFAALLAEAGFRLDRIVATASPLSVIVGRPEA